MSKPISKNKNFLALFSSSAVVQLLPLLSIPFLTRYYTPVDFKSFILFVACILIVSPIVSLRLEHAIVAYEGKICSFKLTKNIILLSLVTAFPIALLVVYFLVLFIGESYSNTTVLWFYLALTSNVLVLILTNLLIRVGEFTRLSKARLIKVLFDFTISISFIFFGGHGYFGLFLGYLFGGWCFIFYVYSMVLFKHKRGADDVKIKELISSFSKYDVPAALLNTLTLQLPVIIISAISPASFAGLFALTNKISSAPSMLINNSIGFMFRNEASQKIRKQLSFHINYIVTLKKLFIIFLTTLIGFLIVTDEAWVTLLGEEWIGIGDIIVLIAPLAAIRTISLPLSYVFYLTNNMRANLGFQIVLLPFLLALFYIPYIINGDAFLILSCYVAGMFAYYSIYIYFQYILSKKYNPDIVGGVA